MFRWWNRVPLLLFLTVSCERLPEEYGTVSFEVDDISYTRSSAGVQVADSVVRKLSFLLFDSDTGCLMRYGTTMGTRYSMAGVPYGNMTVYVVANIDESALDSVISMEDFKNMPVYHYLLSFKEYFPMKAKAEFVLNADVKSVSLSLERYMSRFRLVKVANRLEGALEGEDIILKYVYLTNLQGAFYLDAFRNTSVWYSKYGRSDFMPTETSYIVSDSQLITGDHTFREMGNFCLNPGLDVEFTSLNPMYALPNHSSEDRTGWQEGQFVERFTRMVLVAEIKGTEYYYPVNLVNMSPNFSYDVSYLISRLGSDDPDTFDFVDIEDKTIDFSEMDNEEEVEIEF